MTEPSSVERRRLTNLAYEMTLTNQSLSLLIDTLRKEGAIPDDIATQLLAAVRASSDRLYQIRPKN